MNQLLRIKILAVLFAVLTSWAILKLVNSGSMDQGEYKKIALDTSGLSSIEIQGDSINTILKKETPWKINGKYNIRPELQTLIITAISRMQIKRPVAKENMANVKKLLTSKGFTLSTNGTKQFRIAANENDVNSSYYLKEGEEEAYIIHVPGFTGSLTDLLKQKEEVWRARDLFRCTPMSLQKIKVTYPSIPKSNFEIKYVRPQEFELVGVTKLDTAKMIGYLEQFQEINVDQFVVAEKEEVLSKLSKENPVCILEVQDLNPASSQTVLIYGPSKIRNGFYCMLKERNELVTLSPKTMERILARKEFFLK